MKKRTNEQIFESVKLNGFISENDIKLIKNRSNKEGRDLFNYEILESVNNGYGVPLTEEQGAKGLACLKKFINKKGESKVYGTREINIIQNARPCDFTFLGFYDAGRFFRYYLPTYELNGMEYVPMSVPYIF